MLMKVLYPYFFLPLKIVLHLGLRLGIYYFWIRIMKSIKYFKLMSSFINCLYKKIIWIARDDVIEKGNIQKRKSQIIPVQICLLNHNESFG